MILTLKPTVGSRRGYRYELYILTRPPLSYSYTQRFYVVFSLERMFQKRETMFPVVCLLISCVNSGHVWILWRGFLSVKVRVFRSKITYPPTGMVKNLPYPKRYIFDTLHQSKLTSDREYCSFEWYTPYNLLSILQHSKKRKKPKLKVEISLLRLLFTLSTVILESVIELKKHFTVSSLSLLSVHSFGVIIGKNFYTWHLFLLSLISWNLV